MICVHCCRCTLIWLLRQYGVMIPQHIQDPLEKYIRFPSENVSLLDPFLKNPLPPSINRKFQLLEKGVTPTLEATTGLTFKKLDELIRHLRQFLRRPIQPSVFLGLCAKVVVARQHHDIHY